MKFWNIRSIEYFLMAKRKEAYNNIIVPDKNLFILSRKLVCNKFRIISWFHNYFRKKIYESFKLIAEKKEQPTQLKVIKI